MRKPSILNPSRPRHAGRRCRTAPEWHPLVVEGKGYMLDAGSLSLVAAEPPEWPSVATSCRASAAPVFPDPGPCGDCRFLVLNLTRACNLRCAYCFVKPERSASAVIDAATALRAAETLFPDAGPIRIGFFGGEPLVAWPVLAEVMERVAELRPEADFSLTTNGTLITAERAAFLARFRPSVILSIDGDPVRHNRLRPFADGGDSFSASCAGLRRLSEAGIRPTLRSTYDGEGCRLSDELEFLNQICDSGQASGVSVEPASLGEGCERGARAVTIEALRGMEPEYMDAASWFVSRVRAGKPARFMHLESMLRRLVLRQAHGCECGAGRGYLTLSPDLELHACHREQSCVGRISSDGSAVEWDEAARDAWRDNRLDARQKCSSCGFRHLCGGGCRWDGMDATGDMRKPDPAGCELTRLRVLMAVKSLSELGPEEAARAVSNRAGAASASGNPTGKG